jgi:L,D-transpeptidase catalytic domain/Sporulation and spore germination/Putative peptidoglycan binding domain
MARGLAIILVLGAALAAPAVSSAGTVTSVEVAFVRDGKLVRVERELPKGAAPAKHALRELLRGPTREERAKGIRTALGDGVRLRSLRPRDELWMASFSRSLLGRATASTIETRLKQIAATLAPLGEQRFAAIATEGRLATTLRLGIQPPAWRPQRGEAAYAYGVRGVQLRLWLLGYLDRVAVSGRLDYATGQALLAFQGWEGLVRTGTVTGQTQLALVGAKRPVPSHRIAGRRLEIYRDRGVLLIARGSQAVRAIHTSTGAYGRTPAGTFRVSRKERLSWSVPFGVWMPYAAYFVGGIATHEYPDVPSYPASHGCVRLPDGEAQRVYSFVAVGTPVIVV